MLMIFPKKARHRYPLFGKSCQTRLFLDCKWSFFWRDIVFTPEGKKDGMVGGLIQHGPIPHLHDDGSFTFTTRDDAQKCERQATEDEIRGIQLVKGRLLVPLMAVRVAPEGSAEICRL